MSEIILHVFFYLCLFSFLDQQDVCETLSLLLQAVVACSYCLLQTTTLPWTVLCLCPGLTGVATLGKGTIISLSTTAIFFFFFFWLPRTAWGDLSSLTRDWTQAMAVKVWSPNHWTAREFPQLLQYYPNISLTLIPTRAMCLKHKSDHLILLLRTF